MARIPYVPRDIDEPRELIDSILSRRNGELLNLDRMLLNSPPFAKGWNSLLRQVRGKLSLPARVQELAICAVAVLTDAAYEYHHHAPEFLRAGGTQEELEALRLLKDHNAQLVPFTANDRAILTLVREMTLFIHVNDTTFAAARSVLHDDQQMSELVGIIATYNMVSRYLVALQVDVEE